MIIRMFLVYKHTMTKSIEALLLFFFLLTITFASWNAFGKPWFFELQNLVPGDFDEAQSSCKKEHGRLPTALELAQRLWLDASNSPNHADLETLRLVAYNGATETADVFDYKAHVSDQSGLVWTLSTTGTGVRILFDRESASFLEENETTSKSQPSVLCVRDIKGLP